MKNELKYFLRLNSIFILIFCCVFLIPFSSCKEIGPPIDFTPVDTSLVDTTYMDSVIETPQPKVVLMEDFTGATCPNCPYAHEKIAELVSTYPGQVAVTSVYTYFSDPFSPEQDFTTQDGYNLDDYLGPAFAYPATYIDRKEFGSGVLYNNFPDEYATYVEEQLTLIPPCNMYLSADYDSTTRKAIVHTTIKYTSEVTNENHLSVMFAEDSIIAAQIDEAAVIPDYVHNHVLRSIVTPVEGTVLNVDDKMPGRVFEKDFSVVLDDGWNKENIEIVAFVHNFTEDKVVLQAAVLEL